MICYNCGCRLSEKNFCTSCGADVAVYKKIQYAANRFYNEGLSKAQVRDLSGAIVSLRQCLKCNKNHIDARNLLGLVYFERGEVVAALSEWVISKNIRAEKNIADDYISMIQNNPGRLETINQTIKKYNQALAYCEQDSTDLAIIQLKKVLSMNPKLVQAHQLLALLYINIQDWEKAKKELDKCIKIDTNNTTTLRYMQEVQKNLPAEDEKSGKKKKEAIVYKSGNDTVIQPVAKKDTSFLHVILNVLIGVAIGVCIGWFLILPAIVERTQADASLQIKEISEKLDAKTVKVDELTQQLESLTQERDNLSTSLDATESKDIAIRANTDLIEAALMYINKSGDAVQIAETLELINNDYRENAATEGFQNLYNLLLESVSAEVATIYYNTGYEAYRSEDYPNAIENFQKAYDYNPQNGEALYFLGNSYYRSQNTTMALEIYQKVIDEFPNTEKARKAENYMKEIQG